MGGWRIMVEAEPRGSFASTLVAVPSVRRTVIGWRSTTAAGGVAAVSAGPGDAVLAGQQILVVEAMTMQNGLRSPRKGTIECMGMAVGDTIEVGDVLVVIH